MHTPSLNTHVAVRPRRWEVENALLSDATCENHKPYLKPALLLSCSQQVFGGEPAFQPQQGKGPTKGRAALLKGSRDRNRVPPSRPSRFQTAEHFLSPLALCLAPLCPAQHPCWPTGKKIHRHLFLSSTELGHGRADLSFHRNDYALRCVFASHIHSTGAPAQRVEKNKTKTPTAQSL